jgi:hypothetical protein
MNRFSGGIIGMVAAMIIAVPTVRFIGMDSPKALLFGMVIGGVLTLIGTAVGSGYER